MLSCDLLQYQFFASAVDSTTHQINACTLLCRHPLIVDFIPSVDHPFGTLVVLIRPHHRRLLSCRWPTWMKYLISPTIKPDLKMLEAIVAQGHYIRIHTLAFFFHGLSAFPSIEGTNYVISSIWGFLVLQAAASSWPINDLSVERNLRLTHWEVCQVRRETAYVSICAAIALSISTKERIPELQINSFCAERAGGVVGVNVRIHFPQMNLLLNRGVPSRQERSKEAL
mmetsp:Transcript_61711/g.108087  ORF Transcript_61711/g.108087 Transcript_61711/m.108087 type:complete len:227 (+) Transcript_61711:477-1157(+)